MANQFDISRRGFLSGAAFVGAGAMFAGLAGCAPAAEQAPLASTGGYTPGTYHAEAQGIGTVKMDMTFSGDAITDIVIDASGETPELGGAAAPQLQEAILEAQSANVDAVSGATLTSEAVKDAAENCIAQAKGEAEPVAADDHVSPIPPAPLPEKWDYETDVVLVGASAGGLVCAARLAQNGVKTLTLEKEAEVGGTGRIATMWDVYGGCDLYEGDTGYFGTPYRDQDVIDFYAERSGWTVDLDLLKNMTISIREMSQWFLDNGADIVESLPGAGMWWYNFNMPEYGGCGLGAVHLLCDFNHKIALDNGAEYLMETTVTALVMDGDKCVGVQAETSDGQVIYAKGNKGVVLSASGFQSNPHMLAKYSGICRNIKLGLAKGTGEVIRMGQGCGADFAGYNCAGGSTDTLPVPDYNGDMLPRCRYNEYANWITRYPWLQIDRRGKRLPWCTMETLSEPRGRVFDTLETYHVNGAQQLIHKDAFVLFDAKHREYAAAMDVTDTRCGYHGAMPVTSMEGMEDDYFFPDEWCLFDSEQSWNDALEDGRIKQADTIEELAEKLGLDPTIVKGAVDDWNEVCASGNDDPMYNYLPEWHNPIAEGPFYGALVSPALYSSWGGLRVSEKSEVISTEDKVIPGLYACFHVAGGLAGEGSPVCGLGDQVGSMTASGFNISKAILGEDWVTI